MKPEVGKQMTDFADLPPVPEGVYECDVLSYKKVDNPYYHPKPYTSDKPVTKGRKVYQPGEVIPADPEWSEFQFQFVLEIAEGPEKGRWLFKRTGTQLTANERNHMYQMFSKILDEDYLDSLLEDEDAPDIDDEIVGQPVKVTTTLVKSKKTKSGKATKVTGFMRSERTKATVVVDTEVDVEDDDLSLGDDDIEF